MLATTRRWIAAQSAAITLCVALGANAQTVLIGGRPVTTGDLKRPIASTVVDDRLQFISPGSSIGGVAVDGDNLLLVSEQEGLLYELDKSGVVRRTVALPGFGGIDPGSYGIWADHDCWWHADYQALALYKLDPNDGSVLLTLPMPMPYLGIARLSDSNTLIGCYPNDNRLFEIDLSNGNILRNIQLVGVNSPIGATWDGSNVWVGERDGTNLHQLDNNGNILRTEPAFGLVGGLAADSPFMWVELQVPAIIYRLNLRLSATAGTPPAPGDDLAFHRVPWAWFVPRPLRELLLPRP